MKLTFISFSFVFLIMIVLIGCTKIQHSVTSEDAKQLVMKEHTVDNGKPSIVSVTIKNNAYYIKWKNEGNKEFGMDKVTKNRKVTMVETAIE